MNNLWDNVSYNITKICHNDIREIIFKNILSRISNILWVNVFFIIKDKVQIDLYNMTITESIRKDVLKQFRGCL